MSRRTVSATVANLESRKRQREQFAQTVRRARELEAHEREVASFAKTSSGRAYLDEIRQQLQGEIEKFINADSRVVASSPGFAVSSHARMKLLRQKVTHLEAGLEEHERRVDDSG